MGMRKLGEMLDWAGRFQVVLNAVAAIAGWQLTKKALSYIPQISRDWASVIAWCAAAVLLFWLISWQESRAAIKPTSPVQALTAPSAAALNPPFDLNKWMQESYKSDLLPAVEERVRALTNLANPPNREDFYFRLITMGILDFTYQSVWSGIFRSQLLLLSELNRRPLTTAQAQQFYDAAASEPANRVYPEYTFQKWTAFLESNALIGVQLGGIVHITDRGKDFLKFLVHAGRSPEDRRF